MNSTIVRVSDLKVGDIIKARTGVFKCVRAYWPEARNACYRAAQFSVVSSNVGIPAGNLVCGFTHRTKVELV